MELNLKGKLALLTGATGALGSAIAETLAAEGADLQLIGRDETRLAAMAQGLTQQFGVRVRFTTCDLSVGADISYLARTCTDIDIVINCAGAVPAGSLFDISDKDWRAGWDTKVFAYIQMCREFYPVLASRGGGVIVNILGTGSLKKDPAYCCGGMANAALDFLTQTLGAQSHEDNIRVVGVSPGPARTARFDKVSAVVDPHRQAERQRPFGRLLEAREVADAVAFLVSDKSAYTSGSILVLDGGASVSKKN